jgi:hypothetical protein
MSAVAQIAIRADVDIISARERGRTLGAELGFGRGELALIATAISELARNILTYAGEGEIALDREQLGAGAELSSSRAIRGRASRTWKWPSRMGTRPAAAWASGCPACDG